MIKVSIKKKWLLNLIFILCAIQVPILVGVHLLKMDLKSTIELTKYDRRIYFLNKAFDSIHYEKKDRTGKDLLDLFMSGKKILNAPENEHAYYLWELGSHLTFRQKMIAESYARFFFEPNFYPPKNQKPKYVFYYQKPLPDNQKGLKIIKVVRSSTNSYIVKMEDK